MIRLEIIANKALEEEMMEELRACECHYFTVIPEVYGRGQTDPKQGDAIWPEANFMLIIYCDEEMEGKIRHALADIKRAYPSEGIKIFTT